MDSNKQSVVNVTTTSASPKDSLPLHELAHSRVLIVEPCPFGQLGWMAALSARVTNKVQECFFITGSLKPFYFFCRAEDGIVSPPHRTVMRLSSDPQRALLQLLSLGELSSITQYEKLIILSPFRQDIVLDILACLGINGFVSMIVGKQSVDTLRCLVLEAITAQRYTDNAIDIPHRPTLTKNERRVLQQTLREMTVYQQAKNNHRCTKTIYTHRRNALIKLQQRDVMALLRKLGADK